jgi:chloramphenicol O-acetyltransferase
MSRPHNFAKMVSQVLEDFPEVLYEITRQRNNHWRVRLRYQDDSRFVCLSSTPSCRRATANASSTLRRTARQLISDNQ